MAPSAGTGNRSEQRAPRAWSRLAGSCHPRAWRRASAASSRARNGAAPSSTISDRASSAATRASGSPGSSLDHVQARERLVPAQAKGAQRGSSFPIAAQRLVGLAGQRGDPGGEHRPVRARVPVRVPRPRRTSARSDRAASRSWPRSRSGRRPRSCAGKVASAFDASAACARLGEASRNTTPPAPPYPGCRSARPGRPGAPASPGHCCQVARQVAPRASRIQHADWTSCARCGGQAARRVRPDVPRNAATRPSRPCGTRRRAGCATRPTSRVGTPKATSGHQAAAARLQRARADRGREATPMRLLSPRRATLPRPASSAIAIPTRSDPLALPIAAQVARDRCPG